MAVSEIPDIDELMLELEQLEHSEREISALRSKIFDRLASFPNEITQQKEREVSAERRALHRRIDELRAQLSPVRRVQDEAGPLV
jgi:uncharacterized coiled-coil DUF342 family protein